MENSQIAVRPMQAGELESVIALWHETCVDTYDFIPIESNYDLESRRAFFRANIAPRCDLWVALENEGIVGFLALEGAYIDRLYVLPGAQRCGAGTALLARAQRLCPSGLQLHTHVKNTKARRFYEKHGLRAVKFGVSAPPESEPDVEYHWRPE